MLQTLGNSQGHLKAGFYGYAKSGKSFTATQLAIGTKKLLNLPGPIAFFDTEAGSGYVAEMVKEQTGQDLLGVRARSFKDLMVFASDCVEAKVSVVIVDSLTHVWAELMDSYLVQLNDKRRDRNFAPLMKLEFSHWGAIKKMWSAWPDWFLNSPISVIVCGRAGAIWEFEKNEESGKKELIKAGTKMRAESEFSFESSLLVEMEREQVPDGSGGTKLVHIATVIGDRFGILDGKSCSNPTFEFFAPHIKKLKPGSHAPVNTASKTETGADLEGSGDWERERKARTILCEEVQGVIVERYPGQSAEEKKTKAALLNTIFGTRSWTAVESMPSEQLKDGLYRLRAHLGIDQAPSVPHNETDDGDLGPVKAPKTPQEASEPASAPITPPEAQKPALPPSAEQGDPGKEVLSPLDQVKILLATWKPKIREEQLIAAMVNLGSIKSESGSLAELALAEPHALTTVAEHWVDYHKVAVSLGNKA